MEYCEGEIFPSNIKSSIYQKQREYSNFHVFSTYINTMCTNSAITTMYSKIISYYNLILTS